MTRDITYCSKDCKNLVCERNYKHIHDTYPHSFADLEDTNYCNKVRKEKK